ncbi:hypothetical protein [Vibrio diabolicus]|uniref:hypothetical protein n=1 Tax=Vibrio diabolicus TaxID=50719 RepID=UPI00159440A9|nr:hypothetical protein [Vibrio diabolicus]NVC50470.1 hypothetical protein [Vibrio diabolicus]
MIDINRRIFNQSLAILTLGNAIIPGSSLSKTNSFSDADIDFIFKLIVGFSIKWDGERLEKSLVSMFLNVKITEDPSFYNAYRAIILCYKKAENQGLGPIECVDEVLKYANEFPLDRKFTEGIKSLLSLYVTQKGFKTYGLINIDGYISHGYLDNPTPYHIA